MPPSLCSVHFAEGNCKQRLLFLFLNKDGFLFSSVTFMTVHLLVAKSTGFGSLNISKYQSNKVSLSFSVMIIFLCTEGAQSHVSTF